MAETPKEPPKEPSSELPRLGLPPIAPSRSESAVPGEAAPSLPGDAREPGGRASRPRGRKLVLWVRLAVLVLVLGGALIGFLLRTFREARATPNDKAACESALLAIKTFGEQASGLIPAVSKADDKPIREMATSLSADFANRDEAGLIDDVNALIHRCGQISRSFRNEFNEFCDAHRDTCVKR